VNGRIVTKASEPPALAKRRRLPGNHPIDLQMLLLTVPVLWLAVCLMTIGLCRAAARGDRPSPSNISPSPAGAARQRVR
jgi:hypothetical protein